MNIYEAIFARKSVRSYFMEPLNNQLLEGIRNYYRTTQGLFGGIETELSIIDNRKSQHRILSVLGVRSPYYLALYSEEKDRAAMNAGYIMQQMALYLCSKGLGSCFIGMTALKKPLQKKNGKKIFTLLAFGRSKEVHTRRPIEAKRLAMEQLCVYKEVPRLWMKQLLEAARLAPSSMNSQPWRFVVYDNRIHIFSKKQRSDHLKKWDEVNFGIMFSNMIVVAEELWLDVDLIRLDEISHMNFPNNQYVLSAILRP